MKSSTSSRLKTALAASFLAISPGTVHADIIVSSSSGVYRYDFAGAWEHTYVADVSNWQGVAWDRTTHTVFVADAANNGPVVQYEINGIAPSKTIMSAGYAGGLSKATIGIVSQGGLIVTTPYFYDLGAAEVTAFNPAAPTDTIPASSSRYYPSGATGITASSTPGRYFATDFAGSILRFDDLGIGGTPAMTTIATGLSGGIRGLALSADESTLWVADQAYDKVISIDVWSGVATDFITTGVTGATDVARDGNHLYVSTSTGVSKYTTAGVLVTADLITLANSRYLAIVPEPVAGKLIVSSSSGVYRYDRGGWPEHTYAGSVSSWQGVAADNSTGNVYVADAANNGPLVQYDYDGTSPSKEIMSGAYAGSIVKATIGVAFNNGLVIANPYYYPLGAAEVSGFNPANPTDTTPAAGNSFYPSNATGITASSVAGRYYFTDFTGIVWQLNNFGIGGTPSATAISSGLSAGIRGLALSADESTLWVADQSGNKLIAIDIATGVATDFITTGVDAATDVLRVGTDLFVSTSTGVDQYTTGGALVTNNLILLADCRYLAYTDFAISSSAYDSWASGSFTNPFTNTAQEVDFDNDGLNNLLEFVLGGDPTINDNPSVRPAVASSDTDMAVTFSRSDESELQPVAVKVQVSADLVTWNPADDIAIGDIDGTGPNGVTYTVAENGGAPDTIVVTIPKGAASRKFARVVATP